MKKFMITKINATNITLDLNAEDPGGGGFPLYDLYGNVPPDKVWFLTSLS